jgi:hypothetical protein
MTKIAEVFELVAPEIPGFPLPEEFRAVYYDASDGSVFINGQVLLMLFPADEALEHLETVEKRCRETGATRPYFRRDDGKLFVATAWLRQLSPRRAGYYDHIEEFVQDSLFGEEH